MQAPNILTALKWMAILGVLLLSPAFAKAQASDSPAITGLLEESRQHAALARDDAATLDTYTRSSISWQAHAGRLIHMKEHANDLFKDFNKLTLMRDQGSPWQQEAIDHITPLLQQMSSHLSVTINHFNENKNRLRVAPYPAYAKANWELMDKTARLISDFVDYGNAKEKTDALEKTMALPVMARENK